MHSDRVSTTGSEGRKSSKPIMEKRRRARINASLAELKSLLLEVIKKEGARHSKMEKADILEMAVKHLRQIQRQQYTSGGTDPTLSDKYRLGFNECAQEVSRYLGATDDDDAELRARLLNHLANCITSSDSPSPLSTPSSSPAPGSVGSMLASGSGSVSSVGGGGVSVENCGILNNCNVGAGGSGGAIIAPLAPIPVRAGASATKLGPNVAGFAIAAPGVGLGGGVGGVGIGGAMPPTAALLLPSNPTEINNNIATFANNNVIQSAQSAGGGLASSSSATTCVGGEATNFRTANHQMPSLTATNVTPPSPAPGTMMPTMTSFPVGVDGIQASVSGGASSTVGSGMPATVASAAATKLIGELQVVSQAKTGAAGGEVAFVLPASMMPSGPVHSYIIPIYTSPAAGLAAAAAAAAANASSVTNSQVSATHAPTGATAMPLSVPVMATTNPAQNSSSSPSSANTAGAGLITLTPPGAELSSLVPATTMVLSPASSSSGFSQTVAAGFGVASLGAWQPAVQSSPTPLAPSSTLPSPSSSSSLLPSSCSATLSPVSLGSLSLSPSSTVTSTMRMPDENTSSSPCSSSSFTSGFSPKRLKLDSSPPSRQPCIRPVPVSLVSPGPGVEDSHTKFEGTERHRVENSNARRSLLHSQLMRPPPEVMHNEDGSVWRPW